MNHGTGCFAIGQPLVAQKSHDGFIRSKHVLGQSRTSQIIDSTPMDKTVLAQPVRYGHFEQTKLTDYVQTDSNNYIDG